MRPRSETRGCRYLVVKNDSREHSTRSFEGCTISTMLENDGIPVSDRSFGLLQIIASSPALFDPKQREGRLDFFNQLWLARARRLSKTWRAGSVCRVHPSQVGWGL